MRGKSTDQGKVDDRAFPIRLLLDITHTGCSPGFFSFMRDEIKPVMGVYHTPRFRTAERQIIAVYFRQVRDLNRFVQRFPDMKLADGVADPRYTSQAMEHARWREKMGVDPGYVTLGQLDEAERGDDDMCNRYRLKDMPAEVADLFRAKIPAETNAGPGEVHPGEMGLVVADDQVRSMTWGFPYAPVSKATGKKLALKPVNNAREDKLDSYLWRPSFERRRCLIPVSAFAEAEGAKGKMTRTWVSLPDQQTFAVAGIWNESDEWGAVYSMVMVDSSGAASAEVHDRMPVILHREDWSMWTRGTPGQARDLCKAYDGEMIIDRTDEPWTKPKPDSAPLLDLE